MEKEFRNISKIFSNQIIPNLNFLIPNGIKHLLHQITTYLKLKSKARKSGDKKYG